MGLWIMCCRLLSCVVVSFGGLIEGNLENVGACGAMRVSIDIRSCGVESRVRGLVDVYVLLAECSCVV